MREIIAVCRSEKKARERVARILDRYFWRIGDRTWRGKATNACLDRVSRELRKAATRNTAVVIHEIRSAASSRKPLIRIGARHAFSEEGVVPVATHPAAFARRKATPASQETAEAVLRIAALFHDLGKATVLFQRKLGRAIKKGPPEADAVRHELFSAAVWDYLFGEVTDEELSNKIKSLTPPLVDEACLRVQNHLGQLHRSPRRDLGFAFTRHADRLTCLVGMLVLTHHRLPAADSDCKTLRAEQHVNQQSNLTPGEDLAIAAGTPFWHESWWLTALQREADRLRLGPPVSGADIAIRASLLLADHLGSAMKVARDSAGEHLANTIRACAEGPVLPADSLSRHIKRVYQYARFAFDATHRQRDRYPALSEDTMPSDVARPQPSVNTRFVWQSTAAQAARELCSQNEGGFFGAIIAGTGTGKTRGAPTILAAASLGDHIPERRYFRMSLGLGLRVLATQSAREYVRDLNFGQEDVSVSVGAPPLEFDEGLTEPPDESGSESLISLPEWLRIQKADGPIPEEGDEQEEDWLRGLSLDTGHCLPAFIDIFLDRAGDKNRNGRRFLNAPVLISTIDYLMPVATPTSARFLLPSLRVLSSDLILDEIDQYDGEDLAAIGRLVFQSGAAGRRVIIMSATLTKDIVETLHSSYHAGWREYARSLGLSERCNILICGDDPLSISVNAEDEPCEVVFRRCCDAILHGYETVPALRRGKVLPLASTWKELVTTVDAACSAAHNDNAIDIGGVRVSVGLVRMTRISHAAALASQINAGDIGGRLRVLLCLHSQMTRLVRGWIEARLKQALTRKGDFPEAGVKDLCDEARLFERAGEIRARDIEIVVITSPVIETGNDLDFDYAIIDPISTRAIIQTAGRVRRHRPAVGKAPNVWILGQSPVAWKTGKLSMPGVETALCKDTRVAGTSLLDRYEKRLFSDIVGSNVFERIDAAAVLNDEVSFPLKQAEAELCRKMISVSPEAPLGRYILSSIARWNTRVSQMRRFRRNDQREICFVMQGQTLSDATWYVDMAPGTRHSALRQAGDSLRVTSLRPSESVLLDHNIERAWQAYAGDGREMSSGELASLIRVNLPVYDNETRVEVTMDDLVGLVRTSFEEQ